MEVDHKEPALSAHTLTLKSSSGSLKITLPFPFICSSVRVEAADKGGTIQVHLSKALLTPWPSDYFRRKELTLTSWIGARSLPSRWHWRIFVEMQFEGPAKRPSDPLDHLGRIISDVFNYALNYGQQHFTIRCLNSPLRDVDDNSGKRRPDWYLVVDPPLLKSSDGSPVLLCSAYDEQLAGSDKKDLGRIFSWWAEEFASPLYTFTPQEALLLRALLRRNAALIHPGANKWQSENLTGPCWMPSFLSPIYPRAPRSIEQILKDLGVADLMMADSPAPSVPAVEMTVQTGRVSRPALTNVSSRF